VGVVTFVEHPKKAREAEKRGREVTTIKEVPT
jgi:hypothetical protein